MARFNHTPIAELAHQLKLSPARLRLRQLDAAEYLVDLLQPDKQYPYDFVCHHVTGYRPRGDGPCKAMAGRTLIEDLILLVEDLSAASPMPVHQMGTAYWTTEALAKRLKVSSKTICRWRRRGLPGRKLRYPDNTVRMAFSEPCIRRFVVRHEAMVRRGAAFSQLTAKEKRQIVDLAREELIERRMRLHELSQIVATKVGRAVETVRYTLRRHDETHPKTALFTRDDQPLIQPELAEIYNAATSGASVEETAGRFGKSVRAVQAIVREVRARKLLARPISYIYNPEFEAPGAEQTINTAWTPADEDEPRRVRPPKDLPPYLQDLYRYPLLAPAQERHLFRRYNYLKFRADRLRVGIDPLAATDSDLDRVECVLGESERITDDLLRANLRLVVSIARRHVRRGGQFFEIVSDGNLALMRAVEKFDYARGFKFSTYASWAVMRNYARTIPEEAYQATHVVTGVDELLATAPSREDETAQESLADGARHLIQKGLAMLSARERDIVIRHYGLDNGGTPMTLDQIGQVFGVTKERIRQIERKAIRKLQTALRPSPDPAGE